LFLQSWAPGFAVLLLGRLLFGIGQIAQQPTRALLTRQWFPPHEVVIANGLGNVFFGLVVGGGLALSPLILEAVGGEWRTTLRIFGVYFAVLALIWVVLGKERNTVEYKQDRDSGDVSTVRGALRYRDLWICGVGFAGASMSLGGFMAFYPTFMLEDFDLSIRLSGSILAVGVIVGGISGMWLGYAAASASRERLYLEVLGALMVGSYIGMVLTGSAPLLWVLTFFNGLAWGFFPILLTVPFNLRGIRPQELAVAYGFTIMFVSLGASLGPLFVGLLQDATGDLRLALLLVSLASVSLIGAGMKIRFGDRLSAA
jgi:cyanate permease